jgi:hypothetical protein
MTFPFPGFENVIRPLLDDFKPFLSVVVVFPQSNPKEPFLRAFLEEADEVGRLSVALPEVHEAIGFLRGVVEPEGNVVGGLLLQVLLETVSGLTEFL